MNVNFPQSALAGYLRLQTINPNSAHFALHCSIFKQYYLLKFEV